MTVSAAEKWRPMAVGGSNEASIPFSTPISRGWFSDDLLREMLMTLAWRVGVIWRDIRDGKCFSDAPAPRSFIRVSVRSFTTSHLIMIMRTIKI